MAPWPERYNTVADYPQGVGTHGTHRDAVRKGPRVDTNLRDGKFACRGVTGRSRGCVHT